MPQKETQFSSADWRRRFQQQATWTRSLRQYLLPRAGLHSCVRLLEVGCGPGAILDEITLQLAEVESQPAWTKPSERLQLFGLDIRLDTLQEYARHNPAAFLKQADAHHLPFADNCFDLVICHFLLLWVADPWQVLREMQRVCAAGGSVLALAEPDYGGRIDYPANLGDLGLLQKKALATQGADTEIGRKLGELFSQAGLKEIETGVLGGQWRGAPTTNEWELEWQVLAHDLGELITPDQLNRLKEADYQAYQSNSRTLFVPTFYAWGKKRDFSPCDQTR